MTTAWINLTATDRDRRVGEEAWCLHEVVVVPYYGYGRIQLLVNGEAGAEVDHRRASAQDEYVFDFVPPLLLSQQSRISYQFECSVVDCAAVIQVGHDRITGP
ncbi:MAG TPA: hypothetical protein VK992_00570 [Candidatus Caenarcaniphilales bacterium]|nr:hypothetical protein [Candidatus Caenarcaniphilales bacterium]